MMNVTRCTLEGLEALALFAKLLKVSNGRRGQRVRGSGGARRNAVCYSVY